MSGSIASSNMNITNTEEEKCNFFQNQINLIENLISNKSPIFRFDTNFVKNPILPKKIRSKNSIDFKQQTPKTPQELYKY